MLHFVIMAGGAGTRFWPESRASRPKQLLPLAGQRTMLQMTVDRLGNLATAANVWILTGAALVDAVRNQIPIVPAEHVIGEPCKRDTAPCIGLAALLVARTDPEAIMAVLAADHVIESDQQFQESMRAAVALVDDAPARIVTFGINPHYPATTFGYIERGEAMGSGLRVLGSDARHQGSGVRGREPESPAHPPISHSPLPIPHFPTYRVARFREKPPADVAKEYFASGNFYWNSGMFVWKAATILAALAEKQPQTVTRLKSIVANWGQPDSQKIFAREFAAIQGISIDYAVMEHAKDVVVIEAPFHWDDVGTWQAAARLTKSDAQGNTVIGRHMGIDTQGSIIRTDDQHLIATVGVSDLIIVHTPDATLVANRRDEESVRRLVKLLEDRGWTEYL